MIIITYSICDNKGRVISTRVELKDSNEQVPSPYTNSLERQFSQSQAYELQKFNQ